MISSLQITNFQAHKDTNLKFCPGVNAIIGPSDSGKTAIIRALRWLVWNRPLGDAFRSYWGGDCSVRMEVDGHTITRIRTNKNNLYQLDDLSFAAVKGDVPQEIAELLNLSPINLQTQFDGPFLLNSSSGEVARHFSATANLDQIDAGITNISKWLREAQRKAEEHFGRARVLKEELRAFEDLDELDGILTGLETLDQRRIQTLQKITGLKKLIHGIQQIRAEIKKHNIPDEIRERLNVLEGMAREQQEKIEIHTTLENLLGKIDTAQRGFAESERVCEALRKQFYEQFPDVCPLCGKE